MRSSRESRIVLIRSLLFNRYGYTPVSLFSKIDKWLQYMTLFRVSSDDNVSKKFSHQTLLTFDAINLWAKQISCYFNFNKGIFKSGVSVIFPTSVKHSSSPFAWSKRVKKFYNCSLHYSMLKAPNLRCGAELAYSRRPFMSIFKVSTSSKFFGSCLLSWRFDKSKVLDLIDLIWSPSRN